MENKRIAFVAPGQAVLEKCAVSEPRSGEVRVRLAASAVSSGTERANLLGNLNINTNRKLDKPSFPRYLGYSSSGIVEALGEGVTDFCVGDRVAMTWTTHTGHLCKKINQVHRIPDEMSFEEASLLHIACFPLAAIRKCHLQFGESALVMGLGILGLFAVKLLRAAGAAPVIAVDPIPEKREKALACGADYALDPFAPDFAETVHKITGGGVNVAIEVTGVGAGLDGALDCMAKMGRVALLGCTRDSNFTIDYYRKVHGRGVSLIGAHTNARPLEESSEGLWTLRDDMESLIRMIRFGRLDLRSMIDEIHTPAEAPEVYARLAVEKAFPIVVFDWRK